MKVLHYVLGIPPVRGGGLIQYATDLMHEQQKQGYKVELLIPGKIPNNIYRKIRIKKSRAYEKIPTYVIQNPHPIPMGNGIKDIEWYTLKCDKMVYADFLKKSKPDIVHIHSLMGLHIEFLQEAKKMGIPMIFTTHDYFGICPITTRLRGNVICEEIEWSQCACCCNQAYSAKKLKLEQSLLYRFYRKNETIVKLFHRGILKNNFKKIRAPQMPHEVQNCTDEGMQKEYLRLQQYFFYMFKLIDMFHFNSELTKRVYLKQLNGICEGRVVAISHRGIKDCREKRIYNGKLQVGYLGGWQEYKGFNRLLQVIKEIYQIWGDMIELHLYSETEKIDFPYIVNHQKYSIEQLGEVMKDFDVLVVPSQWQETFGFVVLEALSYGVPVIVSENVGAKDLLKLNPGMGYIYDGTAEDLKKIIEQLLQHRDLLKKANSKILSWKYDFSFENHVRKVGEIYQFFLNKV